LTIYQQILDLFNNDTEESFNSVAIDVFKYQSTHNPIYKHYLNLVNCDPNTIWSYHDIPLFPISLFKKEIVKSGIWEEEKVFLSSGTGSKDSRSKHYVKSLNWYDSISRLSFEAAGYELEKYEIIGLLPSYLENGDSSLVHMVSHFQTSSGTSRNSNFLYDFIKLQDRIQTTLANTNKKIVLIGVTYALLDFAEQYTIDNYRVDILFTGGMKRKKQEMTFEEIHHALKIGFPSSTIRSEYGMTELFSQAYSSESSLYTSSPSMRIRTKQLQDPLSNLKDGKTGILGVIDLANVDTLSFILSEDLSIQHSLTTFQVIGRMDESDIRGCNLLYQPDYF